MIRTNIFQPTGSHKITDQLGNFSVLEYERDLSIPPEMAEMAYFASQMNVRKRQLVIQLDGGPGVIIQAGEMQMTMGDIHISTDVHGAGDLLKKVVGSKVTGETAIKPRYEGRGLIVLEPTFKFILLENAQEWGSGMVIEDGMFLACEDSATMSVSSRSNVSSTVLGKEGIFNSTLSGNGIIALESPVPADEIIVVDLEDDVLKIDGNMAIAWSKDLKFSVERTTDTLVGSMASGEGLVNVYRGSGRVLVAPVAYNRGIATPAAHK